MTAVRWEEPPAPYSPNNPRPSRWRLIADELRQRPRVWAVVATPPSRATAQVVASQIRLGLRAGMPVGQFDARVAVVEGENRVYARYVGESNLEGTPS